MPVSPHVPRALIERLLHEGEQGLRLIQDLPILVEVWAAFGADRTARVNLLLSPNEQLAPPRVARELALALADRRLPTAAEGRHRNYLAPLQGFVTATVSFEELVEVIAPLAGITIEDLSVAAAAQVLRAMERPQAAGASLDRPAAPSLVARTSALVALIAASGDFTGTPNDFEAAAQALEAAAPHPSWDQRLRLREPPMIRRVLVNRGVQRLASESVRTVKADAARRVFDTGASAAKLVWAVIDSGIDAGHPAFVNRDAQGAPVDGNRIWRAYDFSRLRRLTSYDLLLLQEDDPDYVGLLADIALWQAAAPVYPEDDGPERAPEEILRQLTSDADNERPVSWVLVEPLLRLAAGVAPAQPHGTHVAGILAGNWPERDFVGVCPDLRLLDLRILGDSDEETESAIIGAIEFIRWLNSRNRWRLVHGVNLSIGMKHDVRNWACGQTPVCVACDDLVGSGVVVVAAAGNDGWQSFLIGDDKRYEGYASASIMDPGNAEGVITVGATHRVLPHLYGASFFSSRGPTGDGRMKPDLLAPGEKIIGPLPNNQEGLLDGTSMAAPHVSGVAALLMSRHEHLRGKPAEVKAILMETAVNLGRERAAQGAGLVDAFAALQKR